MHLRMEVRARSEHISSSSSSSSVITAPSRYFEYETANREREPHGGRETGGGGKQWKWTDSGDGIRVVTALVRKRVQESGRKKAAGAATATAAATVTEGRRTGKAAAAAAAANGKGKRKSKAEEEEEGGRPSAGGPHRCGARRGAQSAAA